MRLSFHGAARGVTGSCYLLEAAGRRLLVDCGFFQGERELIDENAKPVGFEASEVDFIALTHAHLDHCGRLPILVKQGFRGPIFATSGTRALAKLALLDAAHMQQEDAARRARHGARRGESQDGPLFDMVDALDAMERFRRRPIGYGEWHELADGLRIQFFDAGHILGSASLLVEAKENGKTTRLVFSGDIGSSGRPIIEDPTPPPQADVVVMETTYGDRDHRGFEASIDELCTAINAGLERGGNVYIPTFALERAQELLVAFGIAMRAGKLPSSLEVVLDSPMAISATEIYRRHPEYFDAQSRALQERFGDPFAMPRLRFAREGADSRALNTISRGMVVLAGSGMCTGGRILHHLKHNLWRPEASVVFVSFAAPGTIARRIIDGAEEVRLFGRSVAVRAKISTINGFSAHAGRSELLAWRRAAGKGGLTYLVHGEDKVVTSFAGALKDEGFGVRDPEMHEGFEV